MLSERIAVINPEPDFLKKQGAFFKQHEILLFSSGKEFLSFWQKDSDINVVLLDASVPDRDAFKLLQDLKTQNRDVYVIMTARQATKDMVVNALRLHADDFWDLPLEAPVLREKIQAVLKRQEAGALRSRSRGQNVDRIKRFIQRNYKSATLDFISKELFLSAKYVSRMFNEKNGLNFRDYKISVKMERAKDLLTKTSLHVSEIASLLGYKKPESFMRIFKRMTHKTPRQYRKEARL